MKQPCVNLTTMLFFFPEIYGMWWSGASDDDKEGKFKWTHSNQDLVYLNWGSSNRTGAHWKLCVYDVSGHVGDDQVWAALPVCLWKRAVKIPREWVSLQVNGWSAYTTVKLNNCSTLMIVCHIKDTHFVRFAFSLRKDKLCSLCF